MNPRPAAAMRRAAASAALVALSVASSIGLVACGDPGKRDRAMQAAARVNGETITLPQIQQVLQQRAVPGEQADAAAKVVLERLIHQSLAVQRAQQLDLDRDPKVQLQLDLARREVLARAYLERVGAAAAAPDADAVRRYYDEHPALFAKRRIFQLQEIAIEARPEQVDALRARLGEGGDVDAFADWLRANGYRFAAVQAVRAAEQLPPARLAALAALRDGQALFTAAPNGVLVAIVAGSREQPVTLEQARAAIEQRLLAERRRALVRDDLGALRREARVEYVGRFAESPPPAIDPAASDAASDASEPVR
ncbi:MAG: EpsD family peptidyl-prolyl cis-trans isomerase [Gammaproteobacteria bacterium]